MRCRLTARARFTNPEMLSTPPLFPSALLAIFTLELHDVVNERRLFESFLQAWFCRYPFTRALGFSVDEIGFNTLGVL